MRNICSHAKGYHNYIFNCQITAQTYFLKTFDAAMKECILNIRKK